VDGLASRDLALAFSLGLVVFLLVALLLVGGQEVLVVGGVNVVKHL
jgi:hypothetical protein